jgi:hypothetical protein
MNLLVILQLELGPHVLQPDTDIVASLDALMAQEARPCMKGVKSHNRELKRDNFFIFVTVVLFNRSTLIISFF